VWQESDSQVNVYCSSVTGEKRILKSSLLLGLSVCFNARQLQLFREKRRKIWNPICLKLSTGDKWKAKLKDIIWTWLQIFLNVSDVFYFTMYRKAVQVRRNFGVICNNSKKVQRKYFVTDGSYIKCQYKNKKPSIPSLRWVEEGFSQRTHRFNPRNYLWL
jgi:hypothetical protein